MSFSVPVNLIGFQIFWYGSGADLLNIFPTYIWTALSQWSFFYLNLTGAREIRDIFRLMYIDNYHTLHISQTKANGLYISVSVWVWVMLYFFCETWTESSIKGLKVKIWTHAFSPPPLTDVTDALVAVLSPVTDRERHSLLKLQQLFRVSHLNPTEITLTVFFGSITVKTTPWLVMSGSWSLQKKIS
jgi:hypothetical protein